MQPQPFMFMRGGADTIPIDRPDTPIANAQYNAWLRNQGLRGMGVDVTKAAAALSAAAASSVKGATIETQVTPTMRWSPKFGGTTEGSGLAAWITKNVVKPRITLNTVAGPVVVEPYGPPRPAAYFNALVAVSALATGGALYLMWKGLRR